MKWVIFLIWLGLMVWNLIVIYHWWWTHDWASPMQVFKHFQWQSLSLCASAFFIQWALRRK